MTRVFTIIIVIIMLSTSPSFAVPYDSYNYNSWGEATPAPSPYVPEATITAASLGLASLREPQHMQVGPDGLLYLLDTGNHRIVVINEAYEVERMVDGFDDAAGAAHTFATPRGLFITGAGHLYIADTMNGRLVVLDRDDQLLRIIGSPTGDNEGVLSDDFRFRPMKVIVDPAGRIYVTADGVYDGIMEFAADGTFRGFVGAPRITPNLWDYFWTQIATDEQRLRRARFLPIEYSSIAIDERGFIYATVAGGAAGEDQAVRRLNPTGVDVLRVTGDQRPIGDLRYPHERSPATITGRSTLVDVVPRPWGVYSVLDRRRGRVFTYDANGSLLYVFGVRGQQLGALQNPVALAAKDDTLFVVDAGLNRITVFQPTAYAQDIHAAIAAHATGQYDRATDIWHAVLARNANLEQAYTGIGRSLLRQNMYKEAMELFRLGNNRVDYSKAFSLYRREWVARHFSVIMSLVVLAVLLLFVSVRRGVFVRFGRAWNGLLDRLSVGPDPDAPYPADGIAVPRRPFSAGEYLKSLQFAWHVAFHPADGFWDLKYERRGNVPAALTLLGLVTLTYVIMRQYTGFALNPRDPARLNIFLELASVLVPFLLWTGVNWSLTTLTGGKGKFRDIVITTAYGLTPIVLVNLPMTALSNIITLDEAAFYWFFVTVAWLWSATLIFMGVMIVHEFFTGKMIWTTLVTFVGMGVVLFIGLLFFSLIGRLAGFVQDIYIEVAFRL